MEIPNFIEEAPYEKGFSKHYDEKIRPALQGIEEERLKQGAIHKKRLRIALPIAFISVVLGIGLEAMFNTGQDPVFAGMGVLGGGGIMTWAWSPILKYKNEFKTKIMPVVCSFFGNMSYHLTGQPDSVLGLEIFPRYNTKKSEDFLEGEYKNTLLRLFELKLVRRNRKSRRIVFKGLVVAIQFPKTFQSKTILKKDLGKLLNWTNNDGGLERVELEDPKFEELFEVYSGDQVEARYLLTTAFMQRLLDLASARSGGDPSPSLQAEFYLNQLVIAIPSSKNYFEPKNIDNSALQHQDIHQFLSQMNEIFVLIDALKLDRK